MTAEIASLIVLSLYFIIGFVIKVRIKSKEEQEGFKRNKIKKELDSVENFSEDPENAEYAEYSEDVSGVNVTQGDGDLGIGFGNLDADCPYCKVKIENSNTAVYCPHCNTPHHKECWVENNGCAVYGCEQSNS